MIIYLLIYSNYLQYFNTPGIEFDAFRGFAKQIFSFVDYLLIDAIDNITALVIGRQ